MKVHFEEELTGLVMGAMDMGREGEREIKDDFSMGGDSPSRDGEVPRGTTLRTTQGAICHVTDQRKPWECLGPPKTHVPSCEKQMDVCASHRHTYVPRSREMYVNIYKG